MSFLRGLAIPPTPCAPESHKRVRCEYDSFEEWEEKAEAYEQHCFGYLSRHQRSMFDVFGQTMMIETIFSPNIFIDAVLRNVAVDFSIKQESETMKLAATHGGEWEPGYYMDDGFGWPVFLGDDGTRRCYEFLEEWRACKGKQGPGIQNRKSE
jgi:hypothetical protein